MRFFSYVPFEVAGPVDMGGWGGRVPWASARERAATLIWGWDGAGAEAQDPPTPPGVGGAATGVGAAAAPPEPAHWNADPAAAAAL